MPISLLVFSFLSVLGAASGAALLASFFGLAAGSSQFMLWLMFLVFSVLGSSGIMMSAQRTSRLLVALGMVFTALGLVAVTAVFVSSLGVVAAPPPILALLVLALLALPGGISLVVAGRAVGVPNGGE